MTTNNINMKKVLLVVLLAVFSTTALFAQSQNFWQEVPYERAQKLGETKESFKGITDNLVEVNIEQLRSVLAGAPDRSSAGAGVIITIPALDGTIEHFRVYEASNFAPELQSEFPGIRAYAGYGIEDPTAHLRLSLSHVNVQTMVLRGNRQTEFIEPYNENATVYAVFSSGMKGGSGRGALLVFRKMKQ